MDALMRRYTGFVRLKASSYFLAGGDSDDLVQEGLVGLYKAADFRSTKDVAPQPPSSVSRQIITAIKTATRFKHSRSTRTCRFSHPATRTATASTLGALPAPWSRSPR